MRHFNSVLLCLFISAFFVFTTSAISEDVKINGNLNKNKLSLIGNSLSLNIIEFPFLDNLIIPNHVSDYFLAPCPVNGANPHPEHVRWPAGAMQNLGTFDCGDPGPTVTVEVLKPGVTGPGGSGTVECIAYIGLNNWACVPPIVVPMVQTGENGNYDIFAVDLDNLPPGSHQLTCACTTNPAFIPFNDPNGTDYAYGNWVGDYDLIDCPALASPFVNHAVTIAPTAPNDVCADNLSINLGTNTALTNVCSADGRVWYRYTVPNNGLFHKVDIDVLQGAGTLANPQLFTVHANTCGSANISGSLPQCFAPGTELFIEAGTVLDPCSSNVGTFEITVSIITPVNGDICTDAEVLNNFGGNNELACSEQGTFNGNINACPDPEASACFGATTEGIWYSFTTDDKLQTMTISGGQNQLFSGTCGSLTSHGCNVTNFTTNPLTTYYLLVGPTGTVTVDAGQDIPSNDDCSAALLLTAAGLNNQSNVCADNENITGCTANDDNVVWYTFTMPAGQENATITVTGTGGNPITDPALEVYSGTCGGLVPVDSDCNGSLTLECLTPGQTYLIAVGSALGDDGQFSISLSTSDNGVVNDVCTTATDITNTETCVYFDVTTNTTDACPESFNLACNGGNNNADATVWLEFTPPVGVTSMNIRNITPAGAYLSIFTTCTPTMSIPGGGCIFGAGPTADINVTGGTTYYIAVAIAGNEGVVDFEIKYNDRPANDACASANGTLSGTHSNLCATQDILNPNCTAAEDDASVWFSYTFPAVTTQDEFTITLTPTGTPAISNPVVAVYESCNAGDIMMDEDGNNCNETATIRCPIPGTTYLIMVSSEFGDEGDFTLAMTTADNGVVNETCAEATVLNLTNALCETPPNEFNGNNTNACPELPALNFGGCTFDDGPGVWFTFTTDANAELIDIEVTGINSDIGLFTNCNGASVAGGCGTAGELTDVAVSANTQYWLLVVGDNGAEGAFDILITEKSNPPSNDECANADEVNLGNNPNLLNTCATEDFTDCPVNAQNEASVWYYYDFAGPGNEIVFTVTGTGANGITNPSVLVYSECTQGTDMNDTDGTDCDESVTLECPVPGTRYYIFVSSTSNNAGDFALEVDVNNTAPPNDNCSDAEVIPATPVCEFLTVTTTTTNNACPEVFAVGGCALDYQNDAVVWYEFTTPVGTTSIEIENISGTAVLSILESCPTGNPGDILPGGDCLSGNGTDGTPLDVNENTTYYIAIGIPGNTGDVDFDIKYNLEPENDDPCGGNFTATVVNNGSTLSNQDNTCATDDDEMCGDANIANTLWYEFTITAPNNSITITVTGTGANPIADPSIALFDNIGAGTPNEPCSDNSINEDCDGDGTVTFNCLNPGTYLVQVGSTTTDAGEFSINISQSQNTAVANDQCTDAEPIVIDELCVPLDFSTTNIDACPENLPAGSFTLPCDFNSEETSWYVFTAPGMAGDNPTMDFTFTSYSGSGTPFMGIFEFGADCTNLTPVSTTCRQGLNTTFGNIGGFTPGNQYLIAISSFGDTGGNFDFTVKFNLGPDNDDPCSPNISADFVVPTNGVRVDGTTLCAGGDPSLDECSSDDQENVVFFEITIPDGVRAINIRIDARNTNGTPIPAGSTVVAGLWETACNSTDDHLEAACLDLGEEYQFACYEPGTYMIQVSTSSANEGDFSIQATEVPYDAACTFAEEHDICADAELIESGGVYCEPITIQSCNVSACPENFPFSADCPFNTMPVVWYTFTVDAGVSTIDLTNLISNSGTLFMALFEDNGCMNPPTDASDCITANTTGIAVNEGQTYYLAVGTNSPSMAGSDIRFNIQFNLLPENDDPDPNSPNPPVDLSGYGSHTGTTCCAVGFNDDPNQDVANVECGGATNDNAVWYTYTVVDEEGLEIFIDPAGANPISGNTTVEVLLGTAAAPGGALFSDNSYHCGTLPATVKFGCLSPGDVIWIKVASRDANCGDFTIAVMEPRGCEFADTCEEITGAQTMETAPTDLNCGNFVITSIPGCLDLACPEETLTDCGIDQNPTVWFQIDVDEFAIQLFTFVETGGSWQPVWTIYSGTCDNLTLVPGGTIMEPTPCSNGDSNPDAHNVGIPLDANGDPITTLFVAVSGVGNIDDPNFTLSAYTQAACVSCIGNDACTSETTFEITDRSSDRPLDDLLFCQGEDVRVCLEFYYDPSETGVDWFHGLIPNFGRGWDMDVFDPDNVTVSPAGAEYLGPTDGACAPTITETMPLLCSYVDDLGILRLCNIKCGNCPCTPPLAQGSALPFGWFWSSNGGAGCQNTCAPSTRYGVPGSQAGLTVEICMNLRTRVFDNIDDCNANRDLQISFVTTSDGVSGCWNDPIAECKLDVAQVGPQWELDCTPPVLVDYEDVEICDNATLNSEFITSDGSATPINIEPIPNPNVTGMNPYTFPNGSGTVTDMLDNITTSVQVAEYIVWAQDPSQLCPGPRDTFRVTIYPSLLVVFDPLYVCDGFCAELVPQISGGTGNYVDYNWSTGDSDPTITVCPTATTTYFVTITDDLGCSGVGSVEVEKKLPISFDIEPEEVEICQDGSAEEITIDVTNVVANGFYSVSWDVPSGLDGFPSGNGFVIFDETSIPSADPYILCATLVDQFGCEGEECIEVRINFTPVVELLANPAPACGETTVDLLVDYIPLDLSNPAATFFLYDCDDVLIDQIYSNTGPDFLDVQLPIGASEYCFKIVVIDEVSGCQNTDELVLLPVIGTEAIVSPNVSICQGGFTTLSVTNASQFVSFAWSPGSSVNPNFTVSPSTTTQYSVTATDANGCTSQKAIVVTVNPNPSVSIGGSLSFCPGGSTTLTASAGSSFVWSTPTNPNVGTGQSLGPITSADTYTVVVTNANGCTGSATVNVVQDANLTIVVPPITLCDNNPDSLDAGAGFSSYSWSNAGGDPLGNGQKLEVTAAGTYFVTVSDGVCTGNTSVVVTNNNTPVLNLVDTVTVCRLNTGLGATFINFGSLQNGATGQWFNTDLAPVDVTDWNNVSFLTVGSRDTFTFVFITDNAVAPCDNVSDTIEVVVRNCACPAVAVNAPPVLCNSTTGTNSTNLNNLRLHSNPGTWSVVSGPTPAPTISTGVLSAANAAPGVYRLRFTLNPLPGGNCPDSAEVNLTIMPAPVATTIDTVLCNAVGGSNLTSINLNDLLAPGSATGGTWTQTSGTTVGGTLPNINVVGMSVGTVSFTYTTNTAMAPCADIMVPVDVRIRDCSCPDVVIRPDTLCNGSMTLLDLENPLRFTVDPASTTGVWTINAPASITNVKFLNPFGLPANNYTATFTISGNLPAQCQRNFTKTIVVRNQTIVENTGSPCSENTGQGATTVNLFSLLRSGFTSGGTWTQVSPATPALTIPANGIVDFVGQAPTSQFVFRYTVNASLPCTPVDVTVNVRDCNCPPIILNPAQPLCNNGGVMNGMLDLTTLLDPSSGPGVWSVTFQGNPVTLNNNVLDVNGQSAGIYRIRYTLVPVPGGTCERFREITVEVENYVSVNIMDGEVCNSTTGGNVTTLDLLSLIEGVPPLNGQWFGPNGNPIVGVPTVNFNGIAPGLYDYTYVVNNEDPCVDFERTIQVEVLDCSCPPFTLRTPADLCNNTGTLDLATLETAVPVPGTWGVTNSNNDVIPITNKVLNLTGLPEGAYTLTYTVTNPQPGCPPSRSVTLNVFEPKNSGVGSTASFCTGVTDVVTLFNLLSNADAGGVWTSTQVTGFNATNGTFRLSGIQPGLYTFTYSFTNQAPCPNTSTEVFVRVNPLPVADAGADKNIDCVVRTASLGGNSTTGGTIVYTWTLNGNTIGNTATITANAGGTYILEVSNTETGCKATDEVDVDQADDLPVFDVDSVNVRCFNENNGSLTITNLTGGVPPYQYSFDGGATFGTADRISNLRPGTYRVQVRESNGCVNEVVVNITQAELLAVELGEDVRINLGDSVTVEILTNIPDRVTEILWTANGQPIFVGQRVTSFVAKPDVETVYTVTLVDENGCTATADIIIRITKVRVLEIPNIIYPEAGDVTNQTFIVYSDDLDRILKFKIYDRWGNLVYSQDNIDPKNEVERFWNGRFDNKPVEQGVYVYVIDVLFKDGFFETRAGDVTVIRNKN